jgi:PIGA (GPI anchor biosynthesis)
LPIKAVYNQNVFPTVFSTLPLIRLILIREKITVVHGHSVGLLFVQLVILLFDNTVVVLIFELKARWGYL